MLFERASFVSICISLQIACISKGPKEAQAFNWKLKYRKYKYKRFGRRYDWVNDIFSNDIDHFEIFEEVAKLLLERIYLRDCASGPFEVQTI